MKPQFAGCQLRHVEPHYGLAWRGHRVQLRGRAAGLPRTGLRRFSLFLFEGRPGTVVLVVALVVLCFGLGVFLLFALGLAHRLGRGIAFVLSGRKVSRPREALRFICGLVVEAIFFMAVTSVFVEAMDDSVAIDPRLVCGFVAALGTRIVVFVVLPSRAPSLFVEGRSLRYLMTGDWFPRTGTEWHFSSAPYDMFRFRDDPAKLEEAVRATSQLVDEQIAQGAKVSAKGRSFRDLVAAANAFDEGSLNGVLDETDRIMFTRPGAWNQYDFAAVHLRCSALLALRSFAACSYVADALLSQRRSGTSGQALELLRPDVANLHAYSLALQGIELDKAEALARLALEADDSPAVCATLGSILVQSHDPETGIELLFDGLEIVDSPADEIDTRLFLALGLARLGREGEADQQREMARVISEDVEFDVAPVFASGPV